MASAFSLNSGKWRIQNNIVRSQPKGRFLFWIIQFHLVENRLPPCPEMPFIGTHCLSVCYFRFVVSTLHNKRVGTIFHVDDCHLPRDEFSPRK